MILDELGYLTDVAGSAPLLGLAATTSVAMKQDSRARYNSLSKDFSCTI